MTERGQDFNPENETSISMLLKILGGVAATGAAGVTAYVVGKKVKKHIDDSQRAAAEDKNDPL